MENGDEVKMNNRKYDKAKVIFLEHLGSSFGMYREGKYDEYKP